MTNKYWLSILIPVALLCVLYFGFDTVSPENKKLIEASSLETVYINKQLELQKAMGELPDEALRKVERLNADYRSTDDNLMRADLLKEIASFWYAQKNYLLSGLYAEEVALIEESDTAWGIAGTTFLYGLQQTNDADSKHLLFEKSIEMLENAISINPSALDYRINMANVYIANPPQENPMKGILMLRELNESQPESTQVLARLAELSITTAQFDNAKKRLFEAINIDPDNRRIICLLASLGTKTRDPELIEYVQKCAINGF